MNFRKIIRDYFTFTRSERKGIIALLVIMFLLVLANKFVFYFEKPAKIDPELFKKASNELGRLNDSIQNPEARLILYPFDPNTIDSLALDSLSIPTKVKENILRFRNKGGRFDSPEDMRKIYGMSDFTFRQIEPFIQISQQEASSPDKRNKPELFPFNPNTASDEQFERLGFSGRQIQSIRKYLSSGGHFTDKSSFAKFRALNESQKERLLDFVVIDEQTKEPKEVYAAQSVLVKLEINGADSIQLKHLPGIGDVLSKRIIKYRELVGGFYSVSQLKEVYGITDDVFVKIEPKITVDRGKVRKIDLNFSDRKELSRHPYIKAELSDRIVRFRSRVGAISNKKMLLDSMILNIDQYDRISPYF